VDAGLLDWVNAIQDPVDGDADDGGSWYTTGWSWVNQLKTGNLLFQMSFLGIGPGDPRFDAAIDYIERHWQDGNIDPGWGYNAVSNDYQAMYCLMKGLASSGVDLIDTDGDPALEDWFNQDPPTVPAQDFASHIVATQNADGSWTDDNWGDIPLGTAWALLTLEKVTVVHLKVHMDIKPTSCPNPLNVKSNGLLPVAILGTEDLDVLDIDFVTLIGVEPVMGDYEDVATPFEGELCDCHELGPDGYLDMVLHFDTQQIVTALGAVNDEDVLALTAEVTIVDGPTLEARDCVRILKKGKNQ
jgi:hypothetical protein